MKIKMNTPSPNIGIAHRLKLTAMFEHKSQQQHPKNKQEKIPECYF
jgi:hypothetical protein